MTRSIPAWFVAGLRRGGRLGVTGSQLGPTPEQDHTVGRIMLALCEHVGLRGITHGDCIGVDRFAHIMARAMGLRVDIFPPSNPKKRAWCDGPREFVTIHPPAPYLVRNEHGVAGQAVALLGLPRESSRGTWHCLGCAERQGKPRCIVREDGTVEWRRPTLSPPASQPRARR